MGLYCFRPPSRRQAGQDQSLPKREDTSDKWHSATYWFCLTCFLQCSHHEKLFHINDETDHNCWLFWSQVRSVHCSVPLPFWFFLSVCWFQQELFTLLCAPSVQVRYKPIAFSLSPTPLRHTQQATIVDHCWYRSSERRSLLDIWLAWCEWASTATATVRCNIHLYH